MHKEKIAFIGAGNMNGAIINGLIESGYPLENLRVANRSTTKLEAYSCFTSTDNLEAAADADVIVLGVKPQQIKSVCQQLTPIFEKNTPLIISIAAGINCNSINNAVNAKASIVRAMPNTPVSIGLGATALFANDKVTESQRKIAENIFNAVGISAWLKNEVEMEAIVALSGSGPAYVFLMMQAMSTAAQKLGLDKDISTHFCTQTFLGAAELAAKNNNDFVKLREQVTSPNGTTYAALQSFAKGNFDESVLKAMQANVKRSQEIEAENN